MPSPLGHVIAGVAAGWLVAGAPRQPSLDDPAWRHAALFGALGALPDVDLLVGAHSGPTHSIGAAAIVGVVAALVQLARTRPHKHPGTLAPSHPGTLSTLAPWHPGTLGVACALSFASHILLDWLSRDTTAPIGIMALWPFSHAYYESDLHVFMAISRRYYQGWTFVRHNVLAVAREIAILLPVLALVVVMRRRGKPAG